MTTNQSGLDPLAITDAFLDVNQTWLQNDRQGLMEMCLELPRAMLQAGQQACEHVQSSAADAPDGGSDLLNQWSKSMACTTRQFQETFTDWLTAYVEAAPGVDGEVRQRALFWVHQIGAMLKSDNFFWTNPKAVFRFVQSHGKSLEQGIRNLRDDLQHGDCLVSTADRQEFALGENLATTPGQVVHRNELVEIIQYAPQTATVWQTPIVMIQPWINKYYIFDLRPQNSLVRYLVDQGRTVFITSWKNPTPDMRRTTFEDYMKKGALQAIEVAREITRSPRVHATGYCIGGTLLASMMGWLARTSETTSVADITLFASLLDFQNCGDLAALINKASMPALEHLLAAKGRLEKENIAAAFRLLHPADLIWRHAAGRYFMGEAPPRSDMLFWNSDSTHLPEAMCRFYLHSFYLENRLARPDGLTLGGRPIDLRRVVQPAYVVGATDDHICPWTATFKSCGMLGGRVQYVLADQGHITGIVNPPSAWSKKKFAAGAATRRRDPQKWRNTRTFQQGSWWPHWLEWLQPRSGGRVPPPPMGSPRYPPISPAPGTYVLE